MRWAAGTAALVRGGVQSPEDLAALGLRAPRAGEELEEVTQCDTFATWKTQLYLAVRDGRYADAEAIASLREPTQLALRHVSVGTYRAGAADDQGAMTLESTERAYRDELVPVSQLASVTSCRQLPRLPKVASWRGRRLQRKLLREPCEHEGSSPFWADDLETLKLLERLGADTHDLGWMGIPLLVHAAERGRHEIVRFLVEERGHDPNVTRADGRYSALHWAAKLETVGYLIDRGADSSAHTAWGDSVLAQQLGRDHVPIVDHLLSIGEGRVSRALLLHHLRAQPEMLRVLIRHGVPLDQPIEPRFGERHRPRPLQRVLRAGLDDYVDCADRDERETIASHLVECVELLIENGVDPRVRDCANLLPYHLVEDAIPAAADQLRRELDRLLAAFGGPREEPPAGSECTCGLNL